MNKSSLPKIHIWIFNNPIRFITDQLLFLIGVFNQNGYAVTFGNQPDYHALNIVIENFNDTNIYSIKEFYKYTGKKIGVVLTEHLNFNNNNLTLYDKALSEDDDYMHSITKHRRLKCLIELIDFFKCYIVLGDLPFLNNFTSFIVGAEVIRLPFPKIKFNKNYFKQVPEYDFCFTGTYTKYRKNVINELIQSSFHLPLIDKFISKRVRMFYNQNSKLGLNIAQNKDWKYSSPMRLISIIRDGRGAISIGNFEDNSSIASIFPNFSDVESSMKKVKDYLENYKDFYIDIYEKYHQCISEFENIHNFPTSFFSLWGLTESAVFQDRLD